MDITIQTVLNQNITIVYDSLDLQTIDISGLKAIMGDQVKPMVMDTPEMIVAVYPLGPTFVQVGDKRIRITTPQPTKDLGGVALWEIAVKCANLIPASKSTLISYGFNYEVGVGLAGDSAPRVSINRFAANPQSVEHALGGRLLSFIPRFRFQRDQHHYDLVIEPTDEQHIRVYMNSHFEFAGITLPSQDQLQSSFYEEYGFLVSMLPGLLKGDE